MLRRALLALPPGGALLDVGAGPGHLGAAVAGHFAFVAGIEEDPEARPGAGTYHRWVAGPFDPSTSWERPFDAVVCADVLEHVAQPETLLTAARRWIAPDGLLLASIPNVANLAIRLSLLAGRFDYAERGILDRTHLRFYTRRTGRELLEASGFRVVAARPTSVPAELGAAIFARRPWRGAVRAAASAAARGWPTLFGYQFVYFARPA